MNGELMEMLNLSPIGYSLDASDQDLVSIAYRRELATQTRYWVLRGANEDGYSADEFERLRPEGVESFEQAVPGWLRRRHAQFAGSVEDGRYAGEVSVLVGWPVRLLWCSWRRAGVDWKVTGDTGFEIEPPAVPTPAGFLGIKIKETYSRALPFRPVLVGQVVYGLMCICLVCLVRLGRGVARRFRGRCTNCGYDLRGNASGVCPECGANFGTSDSAIDV